MAKMRKQKRSGKNTPSETNKNLASSIKMRKASKTKGSKHGKKIKTFLEARMKDSFFSKIEDVDNLKTLSKRKRKAEKQQEKDRRNRRNRQALDYRKEGVLREEREGSPSCGLDEKERIEKALFELKSGEVNTIKEAATKWRVHYDKIQRRASGRTAIDAKQGPRSVLWQYEEELLSSWMVAMGGAGFPVTQAALKDTVQMILKRGQRPNPFSNGRPSDGWYRCFIRRNPEVNSRKTSIPFWSFNSNPSGRFQDTWHGKFSHFLSTLELQDKPGNIWVLDNIECQGLDQLDSPKTELRGQNALKTATTICICCNALGQFVPPFIIYSGKKKEKLWNPLAGAPAGTESCFTRYGDVTSDSIMDWFSRHFLRYISEQPVVLLHSGCWGQVTFDLYTIAQEHGIHFFRTPPTVPVGESFFESFQNCWEKSRKRWLRENQGTVKVKRKHLAQILGYSWHEFKSLDHGNLSFGRHGVYPPNQDTSTKGGTLYTEGRVDDITELRTGIGSGGRVITEAVTGFHGSTGSSGMVVEDGTFIEGTTNVVDVVACSTKSENIDEQSRIVHNHQSGADARNSSYIVNDGVVQTENGLHGDDTQVNGIQLPIDNGLAQAACNTKSYNRIPYIDSFDERIDKNHDTVLEGVEGDGDSNGDDETVIYDGMVVDNYIILDPEGSESIPDVGDGTTNHYREG